MKFREWLLDEINKGLARQFIQQRPNLPKYVAKQILQNRVAPLFKNRLDATAPTVMMAQQSPQPNVTTKPTYSTMSGIYGDKSVSSLADQNGWKLQVIEVHPLHFTQDTIQAFLNHQFGMSPMLSKAVRGHDQRMATQATLASKRGEGGNEPIIVVREGDKLKMQEGWHRLYSYLMNYSAPPEEKDKIQQGQTQNLDFMAWKPVKIKAYVGG